MSLLHHLFLWKRPDSLLNKVQPHIKFAKINEPSICCQYIERIHIIITLICSNQIRHKKIHTYAMLLLESFCAVTTTLSSTEALQRQYRYRQLQKCHSFHSPRYSLKHCPPGRAWSRCSCWPPGYTCQVKWCGTGKLPSPYFWKWHTVLVHTPTHAQRSNRSRPRGRWISPCLRCSRLPHWPEHSQTSALLSGRGNCHNHSAWLWRQQSLEWATATTSQKWSFTASTCFRHET